MNTFKKIIGGEENTPEEVYEKFPWMKEASFKNAEVKIEDSFLIWENGTWNYGDCWAFVWENGVFNEGFFNGKIWKKGIFKKGVWEGNGIWENGKFSGRWCGGIFKNGKFHGHWNGGIFVNGTFCGDWHSGQFINGRTGRMKMWSNFEQKFFKVKFENGKFKKFNLKNNEKKN